MRRLVPLSLAAVLMLTAGCNGRAGKPLDTRSYGGIEQGSLFAFAWGGAPGFEDGDPHEVVVLFDPEPADRNHRLMTCNPADSDCRDLKDFVDTGLEPEPHEAGFLDRFETGVEKADRRYLVVADRGRGLATSSVIVATARSKPTRFAGGELRFDRATQLLSWPRLPDGDLFVVIVTDDARDEPAAAITTRRRSWTYPELQGLVQYFHDPSQVRELRPGGRYLVELYAVGKQGWAGIVSNAVVKP